MNSNEITNRMKETSLRNAALIAGFCILIMVVTGPYAEMYAHGSLVVSGKAAETAQNILDNKMLFVTGIFGYLIMLICDVVVAWALYVLLKPVNKSVSLLTAWFRLAYAVIALVALLNLVTALRFINPADYLTVFEPAQLHAQLYLSLVAFENGWGIGLIVFGIHLVLLGYLVFRSGYIPRIMGILLMISGLGWVMDSLRPFFFPNINVEFWMVTVWGELIFMLWLLIRGWKIQEPH